MKIKEITIGVTRTYNYQSYKCELTAAAGEYDNSDYFEDEKLELFKQCEAAVMEQIKKVKDELGGKQ